MENDCLNPYGDSELLSDITTATLEMILNLFAIFGVQYVNFENICICELTVPLTYREAYVEVTKTKSYVFN